jgi:hypothetical protein
MVGPTSPTASVGTQRDYAMKARSPMKRLRRPSFTSIKRGSGVSSSTPTASRAHCRAWVTCRLTEIWRIDAEYCIARPNAQTSLPTYRLYPR